MSEQRCVCSHPYSIHRLNREIGNRNECWAAGDTERWCQCRQYQAAPADAGSRGEEDNAD